MPEHADGERLATLEQKVRSVEAEIHGTSRGLRTQITEVTYKLGITEARVSTLAERIEGGMAAWKKFEEVATHRMQEITDEVTGRTAIENDRKRTAKTWLAPLVILLVGAGILAVASVIKDRFFTAPVIDVREVARQAARTAADELLKNPPTAPSKSP